MHKKLSQIWTTIALLSIALVSPFSANRPEKVCPDQIGQEVVTIPAGETTWTLETPVEYCPGINIQLTGGSSVQLPIILNARFHQGFLILSAHLLKPEEGPVDVTLWWQIRYPK